MLGVQVQKQTPDLAKLSTPHRLHGSETSFDLVWKLPWVSHTRNGWEVANTSQGPAEQRTAWPGILKSLSHCPKVRLDRYNRVVLHLLTKPAACGASPVPPARVLLLSLPPPARAASATALASWGSPGTPSASALLPPATREKPSGLYHCFFKKRLDQSHTQTALLLHPSAIIIIIIIGILLYLLMGFISRLSAPFGVAKVASSSRLTISSLPPLSSGLRSPHFPLPPASLWP